MTSQGAQDEITNVCGQEKKNLILRQSQSNKNLLVNFNKVHTVSDSSLSSSETSLSCSDSLQKQSRPDVFYKKVVLRNFEKFTGKHLC